jgi:tRNA dimethylallyltransferase
MFVAGQPASRTQALPRTALVGYRVLKIGLQPERKSLYERINQRAALMFREGILEETAALLEAGVPPDAKPMQSLGYKQAVAVLSGAFSVDQAIAECQTKTRQYAKRQMTWFRREPGVHWIAGFGSQPDVQAEALNTLANWESGRSGGR